jgi:RHS repeat-associated protein
MKRSMLAIFRWAAVLLCVVWGLVTLGSAHAQETVEYIHTDALGSVVAISDEAGNIIERREYEPFGAQLTPALRDGPGFTGHVQDATTGLTYMQQRYYDPQIGRFLSVDPVTADRGDMRHFNRYAYGYNNPYTFTDPDGRCSAAYGMLPCRTPDHMRDPRHVQADRHVSARANQVMGLMGATAAIGATGGIAAGSGASDSMAAVGGRILATMEGGLTQAGIAIQGAANATTAAASSVAVKLGQLANSAYMTVATHPTVTGQSALNAGEFATGVVSSAAGVNEPPSSLSNAAGGMAAGFIQEAAKAVQPEPKDHAR